MDLFAVSLNGSMPKEGGSFESKSHFLGEDSENHF